MHQGIYVSPDNVRPNRDRVDPPITGVEMIAKEREKQIALGFDVEHDYFESIENLLQAAVVYLIASDPDISKEDLTKVKELWPWEEESFKPSTRIENLAKVGALSAAAIDKLIAESHENSKVL